MGQCATVKTVHKIQLFFLHTCSTRLSCERIFHWGNKITLCARCKKTRKCCFHVNLPHRKGMINSLMTVMCSCLQKSWTQQVHDKWLGGSHVVQPIKKERAGHRKGMITVMLCSYLKKSWTKKGHDKWLGDSHVMCHWRKAGHTRVIITGLMMTMLHCCSNFR